MCPAPWWPPGWRALPTAAGRGPSSDCRPDAGRQPMGSTAGTPGGPSAMTVTSCLSAAPPAAAGRQFTVSSRSGPTIVVMQPYDAYSYPQAAARGQALGKVLGLLGVAAIFTAVGALVSPALGRAGFFVGLIGGLGCVIALNFVR